jgi:Family of unknown function (DUF5427)
MANPKDSEDVLSLLDSLGDSARPPTEIPPTDDPASPENEKELLGFLDDLAKQPSRSQTPRPAPTRTSRDSARSLNAPGKKSSEKAAEKAPTTTDPTAPSVKAETQTTEASGGGWLGGLWSMGSAAMKTAEQKVKELQQTEEAKAWEERVRGNVGVLGKFSTSHNRWR